MKLFLSEFSYACQIVEITKTIAGKKGDPFHGLTSEVWKEVTTLLRYEKLGWKCDNNWKGQEEPNPITG
jgi:hypothetical protein